MFLKYNILNICLILSTIKSVISKPEILQPVPEKQHKDHLNADEHNVQYDHEKFLGEDESKIFDNLPPEESKRRLGVIYDRIDTDKDGFLDIHELKKWIQFTQRRYIEEDAIRQWNQHTHDREKNESILWEEYKNSVYGFMKDMDQKEIEREDDGFSYKKMVTRDRRRWAAADGDNDDKLSFNEFIAFLHPEDIPRMRDVVVMETLEDIDTDKDGKISIDEYIGDVYKHNSDFDDEPDWVTREREIFKKHRDQDGDGYLNKLEVHEWITPDDFDHAEAEAKHLVFEADQDDDARLTKEEVLEKYDLFVGSQATDFGEALNKHDEF